jgi:hypothetical protein
MKPRFYTNFLRKAVFSQQKTIYEAIKIINTTISNNNILIISALLALQNPFQTNKITQNIQTELKS